MLCCADSLCARLWTKVMHTRLCKCEPQCNAKNIGSCVSVGACKVGCPAEPATALTVRLVHYMRYVVGCCKVCVGRLKTKVVAPDRNDALRCHECVFAGVAKVMLRPGRIDAVRVCFDVAKSDRRCRRRRRCTLVVMHWYEHTIRTSPCIVCPTRHGAYGIICIATPTTMEARTFCMHCARDGARSPDMGAK